MTPDAGRLLSLLSHELRSPLGVIRGYLRMLDDPSSTLSNQQRMAVSAALRAADQAAHLLAQASQLAQLHRGEVQRSAVPTGLKALLESALPAPALDPPITYDVGDVAVQTVSANRDQLRATLHSLIAAVARAQTTPGSIAIDASRRRHGNEEGVLISMRRQDLPKQAVEMPLDTTRGGLGLDLPIAEAVVASHGGHITEIADGGRCVGVVVWLPVAS
jgi:signal transduction histidine kinase